MVFIIISKLIIIYGFSAYNFQLCCRIGKIDEDCNVSVLIYGGKLTNINMASIT